MKTILKYIKLYLIFSSQRLKALMSYRIDFLLGLIGFIIGQGSGILFIYLIFQNIPVLKGYSIDEMIFIYGFANLPRGLDHLITDNLWILSQSIIARGDFDKYLTKPINPLFHIIAERFQPDAFGELIIGILLISYSLNKINININLFNFSILFILIICGTIIYTSIKLFFSTFSFFFKTSHSLLWMVYSLSEFSKYPINIFDKPIQALISFIIPFAYTAYIPASYFLKNTHNSMNIITTIIVSIMSFFISYNFWKIGLRHYESAGS